MNCDLKEKVIELFPNKLSQEVLDCKESFKIVLDNMAYIKLDMDVKFYHKNICYHGYVSNIKKLENDKKEIEIWNLGIYGNEYVDFDL